MNLGEKLLDAMGPHEMFRIHLFGYPIPVTDTLITMWLVMAFLIICAFIFTRNLKAIPKGKQNVAETVVELINSMVKDVIGHHWRPYAPYMGTIILFLIFANIISIFNIIPNWTQLYNLTHIQFFQHLPEFELRPPTKDINVTAALAIMSIVIVLFSGIIIKKPVEFLKGFLYPMPVILPFKILDYIVRPTSLCLRLFGNILAAFTIMELVLLVIPPIIPAFLSIYFDMFDGALQAYIFVFLTSLYVAETIE